MSVRYRDLVVAFDVIEEAASGDGGDGVSVRSLEQIRDLIGADVACYDRCQLPGYVVVDARSAPFLEEPPGCSDPTADMSDGYPLLGVVPGRGLEVHRLSDFVTRRQLRRTPMYRAYFGPLGFVDELIVWFPAAAGEERCVSLFRSSRDFSDRDRDVMALLRSHLAVILERNALQRSVRGRSQIDGLTTREAEVLGWVARGKQNKEIAAIMRTSPHTVRTQLQTIYEKLGVHTRTAAAARLF
jgi:DNA-binding CsgD family transcriptional regulator